MHIKRFPPSKKPKARAWPVWQQDNSRGVVEMEGYSVEEVAETKDGEHSDGPDVELEEE